MTAAAQDVWRREAPHVLAAIVRRHGHFEDAEDATQDALVAAAEQWPVDGIPESPRGWLIRVAQRRMIDRARSETSRREREERLALADAPREPAAVPAMDDSLAVMLLCCHPKLTRASQVALLLRAVAGLSTERIAAAFLVPPATMGQRISRAKATIARAGGTFPEPGDDLWSRVASVRHAIALMHTEAHLRSSGAELNDADLDAEGLRMARLLHSAAAQDPENAGLLALLLLTRARAAARTDADGDLVPLELQDRSRWDRAAITEGVALVEQALPAGPVGEFQLQAAIAAVHAEAKTWAETDWPQIRELYRMLDAVAPGVPVTIGRAIAEARVAGPGAGLQLLDGLAGSEHHRVHAARGHLLAEAGRTQAAIGELRIAARTSRSIPEQRFLNAAIARLKGLDDGDAASGRGSADDLPRRHPPGLARR